MYPVEEDSTVARVLITRGWIGVLQMVRGWHLIKIDTVRDGTTSVSYTHLTLPTT